MRYEDKITLPPSFNYDGNKHLMFGVPLEILMGSEGENGLPRVVRDCVTYLRAEGIIEFILASYVKNKFQVC